MPRPYLALDTGSPLVSMVLALAPKDGGRVLAEDTLPQRRTSEALLHALDRVLADGAHTLAEVAGIAVLRGPGSFTGLRIGLSVVLGLHQALGLPVAVVPTLEALALAAGTGERPVWSAVDAQRDRWYARCFRVDALPRARTEPALLTTGELAAELARGPCRAIGFELPARLVRLAPDHAATDELAAENVALIEPPPLARYALPIALERPELWNPELLSRPIYASAPAVTPAIP